MAFVEAPAGPVADRIDAHGGAPLVAPVHAKDRQPLRNGIRALVGGEAAVAIFVGPASVECVQATAARRGWIRTLRRALQDAMVAAQDDPTAAALREHDLPVHHVPDDPALVPLIDGVAQQVARPEGAAE